LKLVNAQLDVEIVILSPDADLGFLGRAVARWVGFWSKWEAAIR